MDAKQINRIIELAISQMRDELSFNYEKIREIIIQFINETPQLLVSLKSKIESKVWTDVAFSVHKLKARYSYFGFDEIEKELSSWEEDIRSGKSIQNLEPKFDQINQLTSGIVDALKQTEYYEPYTIDESSKAASDGAKSVLVAEDDDVNAKILESFIQDWGCTTIRAADGFEAIAKTVKEKPDLIIMDVHMPFLGGLDAIRAIRGKGIDTVIVSMSASYQLSEKEETLQAGGSDFLTKPVNGQSVELILEKYLEPSP